MTAIRALGGPVTVTLHKGLSHRLPIGAISGPLGFVSRLRDDVVRSVPSAKPTLGVPDR